MRTGVAYKLTFPNGKVYIGITRETLDQRIRRHIAYARSGKPYALSAAIRKYGEDAFTAEVVASGTWQDLKQIEIRLIAEHDSMRDGGYNMTGGGEGSLGVALSDVTKAKISAALAGSNRFFSEAHRARLSEVQKGKIIPPETREKMSASAKRRCVEPMPEKDRELRRAALVGKKRPPELMARIWEARKANAAGQTCH